jgi:carboxypeptidase Taq
MDALDALRARLAELADLSTLGHLAAWDQRAMMPPAGAPGRAHVMATLQRLSHDRSIAPEIGAWIEEIELGAARNGGLGAVDADLVRLARRDWEESIRVPSDLAAELARAGAEGQASWQAARAASDFAAYAPALRHNIDLARELAGHLGDPQRPYDALLSLYDHGLTAARIQEVFGRLAEVLPDFVDRAGIDPTTPRLDVPVPAQERAVAGALARVGVTDDSWRVDVSAHPFTTWMGPRDTRLTTRYEDGQLESILAALHEFGHGLYERQIAPELERTNLGGGTSMSMHESQSKLWENHVGRHPAFAALIAADLTEGGFAVEPARLQRTLEEVRPSLIRVSADQMTYPLHIVLRFELELALIEGTLDVADLPTAWNDGMRRLLGVEVPNDAAGVLQDVHWSSGAFGYFPSYALGCVIAAQLWETLEADIGPQAEALAQGDTSAIAAWLGEHVHRFGRRLDTEPLLEQATGRGLDPEPFVRHLQRLIP